MSTHSIAPPLQISWAQRFVKSPKLPPLCAHHFRADVCLPALYLSGKSQVLLSNYLQRAKMLSLLAQIDSWQNISLWVAGLCLDWVHWDLPEQVLLFRLLEPPRQSCSPKFSNIYIRKGSSSFKLQMCTDIDKALINQIFLI